MRLISALTTALLSVTTSAALAQDAGKVEYMNSCVICHGENGKGHGSLTKLLTVEVPDLTQIAARNDGEFPMLSVIHIIDGRTRIRGHGDPMPIWGQRFKEASAGLGSYESELLVRGRVLALATYLEGIQE
ncbi:c-type cytochrome [Aquicoccus sp. SCR17]|nr:c-type cytochrome [Carideicomes alvinocaridis]